MSEKDNKLSIVNDLILFLYDKDAIKIGDFTLSSGKRSKFYLDLRILQSYPTYFRKSIFLLFDSNRVMINVPIGIENKIGVNAARPINPYVCHILTILLLRGVKILFFGFPCK